jgi:hypothetical protein
MLGCGSQSCIWSGDKAGQRYQKRGAKRIEFLLSTLLIVGADISTALFMLFIGMSLSSELQFGSRISFDSVQVDQSIDPPSSILVA